jgi:UDP-N-acetylglucosamine 2-epimerase
VSHPVKLLLIAGTRPELIKQAPLSFAAAEDGRWQCRLCFTGQHTDMGQQILEDLRLSVDQPLEAMPSGQAPEAFLGATVTALGRLFRRERPDWVAVQGDTTSALAGALAAFYEKVPIVHIEAGLRTYDPLLPFPEEVHRQLISRLALAHAAPTRRTAENLLREGVAPGRILECGNTGIDCLLRVVGRQREEISTPPDLPTAVLAAARVPPGERWAHPLVLVTLHRRESFGGTMQAMCRAIRRLACAHPHAILLLPVHPNPRVRDTVRAGLAGLPNVVLSGPLGYSTFAWLLDRCAFVMTDSGGIQEEAPALGKPVLVLRDVTERPEAVACGAAELVGCNEETIVAAGTRLLGDRAHYERMATPRFPFGDGQAARRILDWLPSLGAAPFDSPFRPGTPSPSPVSS